MIRQQASRVSYSWLPLGYCVLDEGVSAADHPKRRQNRAGAVEI
jgi:hypothetical protein